MPLTRLVVIAIGLALAGTSSPCRAEEHRFLTQFVLDRWDTEAGLPHNKVQAISQDARGFLWVGTEAGVARFDGVRFTPFAPAGAAELARVSSRALYAARDGAIWIGTDEGRVYRVRENAVERVTYAVEPEPSIVRAIAEDGDGNLWVGASSVLYRFEGGLLVKVLELEARIFDLRPHPASGLLIAGAGRILHLDDGRLTDLSRDNGFPDTTAFAVRSWRGELWAATSSGLWVLRNQRWEIARSEAGAVAGSIHDVIVHRDGALWTASRRGVARWDGQRASVFTRRDGLSDEETFALFEDREGGVWVGTRGGGLNRFRVPTVATYTDAEGLSRNDAIAVLQDRSQRIWLAYGDSAPDVRDGDRWSPVSARALEGRRITALAEDEAGTIWFGTDGGLVASRDGRFEPVAVPGSDPRVESLVAARGGGIWFLAGGKVWRRRAGIIEPAPFDSGRLGDLYWIFADLESGLWLATPRSLLRARDGEVSVVWSAPRDVEAIAAFAEGRDGTLWLGTDGSGLVRIADGEATVFSRASGLPDGYVQQILEDADGRLWLGSHVGIIAVDPADLVVGAAGPSVRRVRVVNSRDGMRSHYCQARAQPPALRAQDGRLWFTTSQGVSVLDPAGQDAPRWMSPTLVTGVTVDGRHLEHDGMRFPPGRGRVEVHYTAANLSFPSRVRFRYRLEGFDSNWSEPRTERSTVYENLNHGRYRFQVVASDGAGRWDPVGASVSFTIEPHVYQTVPFYLACVVGLVVAIAMFVNARTRALRRRTAELEERVADRTADLQKERDAARRAAQSRSEFLANMSHEIRTPLNGIIGMTDLVLDSPLSEQQRADLSIARRAGDTLLAIVNDVLDLSKIEAGKMTIESIPFDLRASLEGIARLLGPAAEQKGLVLRLEFPQEGSGWVLGDPTRVRQIVLNFASNALKFTERGEITIRASRLPAGEASGASAPGSGGERFRLAVEDTGIGIPRERQNALFEQFAQVDTSTARRFGGTGLGLSIARRLAELMGGSIGVASEPGHGSTFWVDLPLPGASPASPANPLATAAGESPFVARVLAADDNGVNQLLIRRLLERLGCQVEVVGDGREVLAAWAPGRFDLVLMDCEMPGLDGFDATREIRRREAVLAARAERRDGPPAPTRTPVIAVTARAMSGDREHCLAAGMDDYLSKPIRIEELTAVLRRWVSPALASSAGGAVATHPSPGTR